MGKQMVKNWTEAGFTSNRSDILIHVLVKSSASVPDVSLYWISSTMSYCHLQTIQSGGENWLLTIQSGGKHRLSCDKLHNSLSNFRVSIQIVGWSMKSCTIRWYQHVDAPVLETNDHLTAWDPLSLFNSSSYFTIFTVIYWVQAATLFPSLEACGIHSDGTFLWILMRCADAHQSN